MKTTALKAIGCCLSLFVCGSVIDATANAGQDAQELMRLGLRGVHFVPNHGQWEDQEVVYGFKSRGLDVAFRE